MKSTPPRLRLVDYLIEVLRAHAQTLSRLAAFFGEDIFLELLENQVEDDLISEELSKNSVRAAWTGEPSPGARLTPYVELEGAVREFSLPAVLEFHLWAYPPYRQLIESSLDLNATFVVSEDHSLRALVELESKLSELWMKKITMPPDVAIRAERVAQIPWLRFRSEVLRRLGERPLNPAI